MLWSVTGYHKRVPRKGNDQHNSLNFFVCNVRLYVARVGKVYFYQLDHGCPYGTILWMRKRSPVLCSYRPSVSDFSPDGCACTGNNCTTVSPANIHMRQGDAVMGIFVMFLPQSLPNPVSLLFFLFLAIPLGE